LPDVIKEKRWDLRWDKEVRLNVKFVPVKGLTFSYRNYDLSSSLSRILLNWAEGIDC